MNDPSHPSTDQRGYSTEWAQADIRVVRRGDSFKLEIRALDDVGCNMHHTIDLQGRDARDLRSIWVEIT